MDPNIFAFEMQGEGKQVIAASYADSSVNSGGMLHYSGLTGSDPKLKMHWTGVRPSKIKNKNYFLFFNCVLFEKLVFNIIYWHYIN